MRMLRPLVLVGLAAATVGCDSIRLATAETHDTVISRRTDVVAGSGVRAEGRVEGSVLHLRTYGTCDMVEMNRIRRHEVREADEDLTEEGVVLGLATIPLTTGIVILADAHNVHPDDRHSRLYNPIGQEGAYIVGSVLTGVGGLLAGAALVQLFRVAAAGEEVDFEVEERGTTLKSNVTCSSGVGERAASVTIMAGGTTVASLTSNGTLTVDLATVVPRPVAEREFTGTVMVQGQTVLEFDMAPVRAQLLALEDQRDEEVWQQTDLKRCRTAPVDDTEACHSVEAYLEMFPEGAHAAEARALLSRRPGGTQGGVIASDPTDEATREAARRAAEATFERARQACRQECTRSCAGKPDCLDRCVDLACPREENTQEKIVPQPPAPKGGKR
jgi:hypothetical protein